MHFDDDEQRALIVSGEDASLQFDLKDERGRDYPLTGCNGVSGQFAAVNGIDWITVVGYVVSEDRGIVQIDLTNTSAMFIGTKQNIQLLLTFSSGLRKVQFKNVLDVVSDLTANPPTDDGGSGCC